MRLSQDQFIGSCLTATLAKDDSPLVEVGFVRDSVGNLLCENVFRHESRAKTGDANITDPSVLSYTLTLNDDAPLPMKHECVPIGMGTILSRLIVLDKCIERFQAGDVVRVKIDIAKKDGRHIKTLCSGEYTVPVRMHPLGYPTGPEGYMVQVFPKNFIFMQPARNRFTFQINLCEYEEEDD
jgi:hypothetical protein